MYRIQGWIGLLLAGAISVWAPLARADEHTRAVHFERSGQICLSAEEKQRFQADLVAHPVPPGATVRLLAFSDGMEMTAPRREDGGSCVFGQVPADLRDHARIAGARGLAYLEAAREVASASFAGATIFVVGADPSSFPPGRAGVVTIVLLRSSGRDLEDRRVELAMAPPVEPPAERRPLTATPLPDPQPVQPKQPPPGQIPSTLPALTVAPSTVPLPNAALGWLAVGAGGAVVGSTFLGMASYEKSAASTTFDRSEAATMRAEAHSYGRTGGVLLGLGAALVAGVAIVASMRPSKSGKVTPPRALAVSGAGVGLRW